MWERITEPGMEQGSIEWESATAMANSFSDPVLCMTFSSPTSSFCLKYEKKFRLKNSKKYQILKKNTDVLG